MSRYRFLADHSIDGEYYEAGTTASTADAGGTLPVGWVPSGNVDPLDTAAVTAFWSAGPYLCGLIRQQWSGIYVAPPVTYWTPTGTPGLREYKLTGLGAALPVQQMSVNGASFGGIPP